MRKSLMLLGLAGLAAPALAGAPTLVLDDFDSDPNDEAGGPRQLSTTILGNPFGQAANFEVDTAFSGGGFNGALFFNAGIGVEQEAAINWNGGIAGLNFDAVAAGVTAFEFDFAAVDQDFTYIMRLFDGSGGSASISGSFLAGGMRTETLLLGDFSFSSFDATDVDEIELILNVRGSTASLDFAMTEFRAVVPAPGAVALLGLAGLTVARRRR
tara:strand:+ start:57516 stop:58154 length:639 start_codon:yes stop_codon:yes gene_type:complete